MAKTCAQFITRIKQLVGRSINLNSTLDLDNIILDALNEAQLYITRKLPHILELQTKDITTLKCITDHYEYAVPAAVAHLSDVWILDGSSSVQLTYVHKNEFDAQWPDVPSVGSGLPSCYTRRGSNIEFNCPISSDYNDKVIRFDYCKWPIAFTSSTSTQTSSLINADYGLILFAWSEALRVLAKCNQTILKTADEKLLWFSQWLDNYSDYHDKQTEELTEQ